MEDIKFKYIHKRGFSKILNLEELESYWTYGINDDDIIAKVQYVGIKDINKEDIYNGDIIKNIKTGNTGKIIYSSKNASFEIEMINDNRFHYRIDWFDDIKVIGNIYENKELLGYN